MKVFDKFEMSPINSLGSRYIWLEPLSLNSVGISQDHSNSTFNRYTRKFYQYLKGQWKPFIVNQRYA